MKIEEQLEQELEDEEALEEDQYLIFEIRGQEYGLQALRIKEITSVLKLTEVPQAPSYVEGILNHRGDLVSVISFRRKFGFDAMDFDEDTRVIMVEKEGHAIGLLVDAVEEVIKIPEANVTLLPESIETPVLQEYVTGVGMMGDRLVTLLDADKVLSGAEAVEMHQLVKDVGNTIKQQAAVAKTNGLTSSDKAS